jgi:hypothetical protein
MDDWIYWHFCYNYNQLAHNQCLPQTRSIPYWTTSVFSSTVTELGLIYESVTSTATALNDCLTNEPFAERAASNIV